MKNKFLKISIIVALVLTMTLANFIFVGSSFISYAKDILATNHANIEFNTYFKDKEGKNTNSLEITSEEQEQVLYLNVNVKKDGYFNGKVEIANNNFTIVSTENQYVNRIEGNTIYLNQLNAGTNAEIDIKIKPVTENQIDTGLLDMNTEITLTGEYKDSTEKNITINSTRNVNLKLVETNTPENAENSIDIITNKVMKINGEEKRIIQFSLNLGLKENNYPIKNINSKINIPEINGQQPEVVQVVNLNNMTSYEYKNENGYVEFQLSNELTQENKITWKKSGNENIILTYIYEKDANLDNIEITAQEKITLYNDKEIQANDTKITLNNEEKDTTIAIVTENSEQQIFKGKLYSGIDRSYNSTTRLVVNLANAAEYISVKDQNNFVANEDTLLDANIIYTKTSFSKQSFDEIFGANGFIEIINQDGQVIGRVDSTSVPDESGNINIEYTNIEAKNIEIRTSAPIKEGTINFNNQKTIKQNDINIVKNINKIQTTALASYNINVTDNQKYTAGMQTETKSEIVLNETKTIARLEINKDTLSTVVENSVEMRAILNTNSEEYNLYENPTINITLPEEIEGIEINSIDLVYENELTIQNYTVNGRILTITLAGKQTQYKEQSIEGATIIINADIKVNKKSATVVKPITMEYINGQEVGTSSKDIQIVAPTDVTAINSIKDLGIETVGQEEKQTVSMEKGQDAKSLEVQLEIINNNQEPISNMEVLGTFPTDSKANNLGVKLASTINMENATIYYTENENATDDLQNTENGWTQNATRNSKKYLIQYDSLESGQSIIGTYNIEVPENLEYNQKALEGYDVSYINSVTNVANTIESTDIEMNTGVGPRIETALSATVGNKNITSDTKVKNGEVIKYHVEISNTGSEEIQNVLVTGQIPEGTTLVEPVENYEYTGSSYYKEVETDKFEKAIEKIAVGEKAIVEYEVRVNSKTPENTTLTNTIETKYGEAVNESNEIQTTTEGGNLRVSVKKVTDRNINIYGNGAVEYFAIIENISESKQDNVKVETNISENLEIEKLTLYTGMGSQEVSDEEIFTEATAEVVNPDNESDKEDINKDVQSEVIQYDKEVDIGSLEVGEVKVLSYSTLVNTSDDNKSKFYTIAKDSTKEYTSNVWTDEISNYDISMTMISNIDSKYVKAGDIIEYTIVVNNNSESRAENVILKDTIPEELTITNITVDGQKVEGIETNQVEIRLNIMENGSCEIKIETMVNEADDREEAETISNKAVIEFAGQKMAETDTINHIIEPTKVNDGDNTDNGDNNSGNGDIAEGTKMISGLAWYDENANGIKDENEKTLDNVKVKLLNTKTNNLVKDTSGNILETTTNGQGMYVLDNIVNGQYIVIFEYNTTQYTVTKYKVQGVDESKNSDAMLTDLNIENNTQKVTGTDIISIEDNNISDINIGLIELKTFDLKLEKFVSKIILQNSAGTTVREFNNEKLAKVEIDAKQLAGTTVIIEYKINVTNAGEIDGYARKVADYMPNDLQFSSELNKDWYQQGGVLYNSSIANDKIAAGETKTLTLTLTKTMNENNTGLVNNTAEIVEAYNELGLGDINSTPANKVQGENDMDYADVILSIRTGGIVYAGITIIVIVILAIVVLVIVRKKNNINIDEI